MESITFGRGLDREMLCHKLLFFCADGATALQGCHWAVTMQIQQHYVPFSMGMHCVAHCCNVAFKRFSKHGVFVAIEMVLNATNAYFSHSPKRYVEFNKLVELIETKGLKLLKSIKTCWVSLTKPFVRLLVEYETLMYKLYCDEDVKDVTLVSFFPCSIVFMHFLLCFVCFVYWFLFYISFVSFVYLASMFWLFSFMCFFHIYFVSCFEFYIMYDLIFYCGCAAVLDAHAGPIYYVGYDRPFATLGSSGQPHHICTKARCAHMWFCCSREGVLGPVVLHVQGLWYILQY